jgi:hypothetical protein
MRFLYDLATGENARNFLNRESDRNPVFKSLNESMKQNPLPPFEVIQNYLAPGGSMVTDDETGLHYMSFSMRRKSESE